MNQIKKPLLAASLNNIEQIQFPVFATPKIDGIRALRINNDLVSRQFKPIRNERIRQILRSLLPDGSDGEIITDGTFQQVTSDVMSNIGSGNFDKLFTFYWFDFVLDDPKKGYLDRLSDMEKYIQENPGILQHKQAKIIPLYPIKLNSVVEITNFENKCLSEGYEGVMVRSSYGQYKMGRSTTKEGILLKLKKFSDAEAEIIGCTELLHNKNEIIITETGDNKRPHKKEGKSKSGKLGAFVVQTDDGLQFHIGSGFTDIERVEFWEKRSSMIGQIVKFKYFEVGSKNVPRFPIFLGIRNIDDM